MSASEPPTTSRKTRLLFWVVILIIPVVTLELGLRAYFAFQLGPSMLFYGTSLNREKSGDAHSGDMNLLGEYFKYHPHQERFTRDQRTGRLIRATINASGFRGKDFQGQKDPHVIRVVTLGASSTFGFSNRDEETYPYYLEQLLNRGPPGGDRLEVINLGIPHLQSTQILALFETEALPLDPDVVTFYEGVNDSWSSPILFKREKAAEGVVRVKLRKISRVRSAFRWLRDHFVTVVIVDGVVKARRDVKFTERDLEEHVRGKSERFLRNIAVIHHECEKRGMTFIVASQQAKSLLVDRKDIKGVTYEEESELVRRHLAENTYITRQELYFLCHSVLMEDLEDWAKANNVPYVDTIAAIDQQRDCLVSWVHLNPEGNRIVAEAFASAIRRELGIPAPM
jgi:lysophospholipase L1-like esterase